MDVEHQAEQWIATLRDGTADQKAVARRGLARHFEAQGLLAEAVDLLVANAREGYRDPELFQALARLYRALGNEYLAASAALEAARLTGRRQGATPGADAGQSRPTGQPRSGASGASTYGSAAERADGAPGATPPRRDAAPQPGGTPVVETPRWRRLLRMAGWVAVPGLVIAAAVVGSVSPISAAFYGLSAGALALLLSGWRQGRRLVRVPDGPLGDGALLFAWLLTLLAAGAVLPRGTSVSGFGERPSVVPPTAVAPTSTSGGPSPSPSPSPDESARH